MFPAMPQRTADSRFAAPEPITAPEITCVVESGYPKCVAREMTAPPELCAVKPCVGSIAITRWPSVRMIRQPPAYVPAAIASPAETLTQSGM